VGREEHREEQDVRAGLAALPEAATFNRLSAECQLRRLPICKRVMP
jgi:hypothetical protein